MATIPRHLPVFMQCPNCLNSMTLGNPCSHCGHVIPTVSQNVYGVSPAAQYVYPNGCTVYATCNSAIPTYLKSNTNFEYPGLPVLITEEMIKALIYKGSYLVANGEQIIELKYEGPKIIDFTIHENLDLEDDI